MSTNRQNNCKILLVEDEKIPMMVHKKMLTDLGYDFDTAENATEAVNKSQNDYDIILMDIGLPDFSGIKATQKIREYEKATNANKASIIALTAYSLAEINDQCLAAGMDDVANKPISKDNLALLIAKYFANLASDNDIDYQLIAI